MKKEKIIIVLIVISMFISDVFSQIEIVKSNGAYKISANKIDLQIYTIKNTSAGTYWIWFDKDRDVELPPIVRAYSHFYQVKDTSATSFYNVAVELYKGNAIMHNDEYISVYGLFIKELKPNQFFTIIVTDALNSTFSETFIEIISSQILMEINIDIKIPWFDKFKYKEDFIVFP
jgi:hypothetical protein